MIKVINSGELYRIIDTELLLCKEHVTTTIKGVIHISKDDCKCCNSVIFLNESDYKQYPSIFSHTLKGSKFITTDLKYYNTKLPGKVISVTKTDHMCIILICDNNNYYLYSWNPISNRVSKIKKVSGKITININPCECDKSKYIIYKKTPSNYKTPDDLVYTYDFIKDITKNISTATVVGITVVDKYIILALSSPTCLYIVQLEFKMKNSVIIISGNPRIVTYDLEPMEMAMVVDICYDHSNRILLLVSNNTIYYLSWLTKLKTFNYILKKMVYKHDTNDVISSISQIGDKHIIVFDSGDNKFIYKLIRIELKN